MKISKTALALFPILLFSIQPAHAQSKLSCFDSKGAEVPMSIDHGIFGYASYTIGLVSYSASQVRIVDNGEGAKAVYLNGKRTADLLCIYYDGTHPTAAEVAKSQPRKSYVPLPKPRPENIDTQKTKLTNVPLPRPRPHIVAKNDTKTHAKPTHTKAKKKRATTHYSANRRLWGGSRYSEEWTDAVLKVFHKRQSDFEMARDLTDFCPHYFQSSQSDKEDCILRLVSALVKPESAYNQTDSFHEPTGAWSVGLMALSPGECSNASTVRALKNGVQNLICGVNKMASLIHKDRYISGPSRRRGAAAYWSTLRTPYRYGRYKLGKVHQILAVTRGYSGNT